MALCQIDINLKMPICHSGIKRISQILTSISRLKLLSLLICANYILTQYGRFKICFERFIVFRHYLNIFY